MPHLTREEALVLGLRFGLNSWGLTLSKLEIARRLGVKPNQVSAIEKRAMGKIYTREFMEAYLATISSD